MTHFIPIDALDSQVAAEREADRLKSERDRLLDEETVAIPARALYDLTRGLVFSEYDYRCQFCRYYPTPRGADDPYAVESHEPTCGWAIARRLLAELFARADRPESA
jgi:hypothetical protein